jgi:hypothetical protein
MTSIRRVLRTVAAVLAGGPAGGAYRIERADATPVAAGALAIAIMGAGFRLVERRRELLVSRTRGPHRAIVRLPRSRVVGAAPLEVRASERDLVLGLMTAMARALGTLRLRTAELGEIVVTSPADATSPDAPRAWPAARRPRANVFSLGERWRDRLRR